MAKELRCPGQDQRYWKPEDIGDVLCPWCRHEMEIWKDEPFRLCPGCGKEVRNPRIDLGCAKWCKSAASCLGASGENPEAVASLRERLIVAMKETLGQGETIGQQEMIGQPEMIDHTLRVLEFAEKILETEKASAIVVKAAAILHDIGVPEALRKHGAASGAFQELEGPPIARALMEQAGMDPGAIEHVGRIVGSHHSARDIDTPEFRIVWDADWLVNLPALYPNEEPEEIEALIASTFRTVRGAALAREMFLQGDGAVS